MTEAIEQALRIAFAAGANNPSHIIDALEAAGFEIVAVGGRSSESSVLQALVNDKAGTARRIAAVRKSKRMNQEALAEALDCHAITVSKLETGVMELTMDWIVRIAGVLGVPPETFARDSISFTDDPLDIVRDVIKRRKISATKLALACGLAASTLNKALNNPKHGTILSTRTLQKIRDWDRNHVDA